MNESTHFVREICEVETVQKPQDPLEVTAAGLRHLAVDQVVGVREHQVKRGLGVLGRVQPCCVESCVQPCCLKLKLKNSKVSVLFTWKTQTRGRTSLSRVDICQRTQLATN